MMPGSSASITETWNTIVSSWSQVWDSDEILMSASWNTLSSSDVLSASPVRETQEEETPSLDDAEESTWSGSLLDELMWQEESEESEQEPDTKAWAVASICSVPLVWPIGIWKQNNENEVRRLEAFLNSQGESLSVDGVYDESDVAAVNRFQTKYRAQILDPWGINNPTWYVFRTTVSTMNSVACGEDVSVSSVNSDIIDSGAQRSSAEDSQSDSASSNQEENSSESTSSDV